MEQQIQDLIASIKKDGIEEATKESNKIISDAKAQAASIIRKAEEESARLIEDARKSIALEKSSAEASIKQAGRDVSLSLKKSIENEFNNLLRLSLEKELHGNVLIKVLEAVLKSETLSKDVYCYVSDADFKELSSELAASFMNEVKNGLELRTSSQVTSGIRLAVKDGSAYLDLSAEECSSLLFPYISSALKEIL